MPIFKFFGRRLLLTAITCGLSVFRPQPALGNATIIPHPQIEEYGGSSVQIGRSAERLTIAFRNVNLSEAAACHKGFQLLSKRLKLLGVSKLVVEKGRGDAHIEVTRMSPRQFRDFLLKQGAQEGISGKRLEQAYALECRAVSKGRGSIRLCACSDLGAFYGLVSLCQLIERDAQQGIRVPTVRIADWPEIGLRLAKTSASMLPLPELRNFADWMPRFKINLMGLQYHGTNSLQPGSFMTNVRAICSQARRDGILETVVYFCPFRGRGYNFNSLSDRLQYRRLLQWFLDQGAHGIEVDYNDWPGSGTPIEDVLNLACGAVAEKNPKAYILYCPPSRGSSMYRGPASEEMVRILSHVPSKVWPLWTGMAIKNALIEQPLNPADVASWTRATGRRPFLWVNRVVTRDPPQNRPFARPVSEVSGAFVFRGEFLPKDMNRLFEGVHFNAGSPSYAPSESKRELVAYLATAADYVWNPQAWEAVESCRRAQRFTEIMMPLLNE